MITQGDEYQLRTYAIKILVQLLRSFNNTIEAEQALKKISVPQTAKVDDVDLDEVLSTSSRGAESEQDSLAKQRTQKTEMAKAAMKFNFKPKNGIALLIQNGLVTKIPKKDEEASEEAKAEYEQAMFDHMKSVVKFLKTAPSLDKTMIGEFLGKSEEYNIGMLDTFLGEYSFRAVYMVDALKIMLSGFRIPGEGQVVDRMMEKFGVKFATDNIGNPNPKNVEMSADCIYMLGYATMMLQTSLHNPNASKSRMKLDDFEKMLKGVNAGENLPLSFV
jgi:Sec7-like guanine-nucleotide exchange factor